MRNGELNMEFYVEHHSWRRKQNEWTGNIVKKFKKLKEFEKYVIDIYEKYPDFDITYDIFECVGGTKGTILSKVHYIDKKFTVITISNRWVKLCYYSEKIIKK